MLAREWNLFLIALTFYTRISYWQPSDYRAELLPRANRYLILIGALVGTLSAALALLVAQILPVHLATWIMVFASVWLTGAFHEDGLSDTFDALGAWSVDKRLQIMKDSCIGTYGAAVMVFGFGLRYGFWLAIPVDDWLLAAVVVHSLSRLVPLWVIRFLPYVQADAVTKVKPVAQTLATSDLFAAVLFALIIVLLAAAVLPWTTMLWLSAAMVVVVLFCLRWFAKFLGGYTGDLLGASQQIGEWALLAALVAGAY